MPKLFDQTFLVYVKLKLILRNILYLLITNKYDEDQLDLYNIQDAEDTRNRAYAHMKAEIDQAISEI